MLNYNDENTDETDDLGSIRGITPSVYTAITDADGKYAFTAVPATRTQVVVQSFNDGSNDYAETTRDIEIRSGGTTNTALFNISLTDSGIDFELKDFTSNNDNLEITFNKTIDQTTFT